MYDETSPLDTIYGAILSGSCKSNTWVTHEFVGNTKNTQSFEFYNVQPSLKGVLHPRPVFGLFLHISQKLQHIGNK